MDMQQKTSIKIKETMINEEEKLNIKKKILACPICYKPFIWGGDLGLSLESIAQCNAQCNTCKKSYSSSNGTYLDLTINGGESMAKSTELFRSKASDLYLIKYIYLQRLEASVRSRCVSFLYERGWRQCFKLWGNFPGPKKEFTLIKDYLKPVLGGNVVDASCGSGIFTRQFAKSGLFSLVVALDFSEAMLHQCYEFIKKRHNSPQEDILIVRADISKLPFASSTVDALHAGAALHCWPSPPSAVAEISRVLKPGGIFVASTFIIDGIFSYIPLQGLRRKIAKRFGSHVFLSEKELEELCTSSGLINFTCTRNWRFIMLSAMKPL